MYIARALVHLTAMFQLIQERLNWETTAFRREMTRKWSAEEINLI